MIRIDCPNCKSCLISEIDTLNKSFNYIKAKEDINGYFKCDQCENIFNVSYRINIVEIN